MYVEILRKHLQKRIDANPGYSLRAFARDLDMRPSHLSEVLRGREGLSTKTAHKIAINLGLSSTQRQYFCDLIETHHGRNKTLREEAAKRLERLAGELVFYQYNYDSFKSISDWHHLAILEVLSNRMVSADEIASLFRLPAQVARDALQRLVRLGLCRETTDGQWQISDDGNVTSVAEAASPEAMKLFHSQIIGKAKEALFRQSRDQREYSTLVISVPEDSIPEIKERVRSFQKEILKITENKTTASKQIYALSSQFFRLSDGKPGIPNVTEH